MVISVKNYQKNYSDFWPEICLAWGGLYQIISTGSSWGDLGASKSGLASL